MGFPGVFASIGDLTMAHCWYVLHTNYRKEMLVVDQLMAHDLELFFPTIRIERGHRRGVRDEPFFPHYIFVKLDLDSGISSMLKRLPGIRTIVHFDEHPAVIADTVIEELRNRLQSEEGKPSTLADWLYEPGDPVRIHRGPFTGLNAVFQKGLTGSERVQILLEVLGRSSRVQINVNHIEAI